MISEDSLILLSPEERRKQRIEKDNQNDPLLKLVEKEKSSAPHPISRNALSQIEQDHRKALDRIDKGVEETRLQNENLAGTSSPRSVTPTTTTTSKRSPPQSPSSNPQSQQTMTSRTVVLNALKAQEKRENARNNRDSSDEEDEATLLLMDETGEAMPHDVLMNPSDAARKFMRRQEKIRQLKLKQQQQQQQQQVSSSSSAAVTTTPLGRRMLQQNSASFRTDSTTKKNNKNNENNTKMPMSLAFGGTSRHFLSSANSNRPKSSEHHRQSPTSSTPRKRTNTNQSPVSIHQSGVDEKNDDHQEEDDDETKPILPDRFNQLVLKQLSERAALSSASKRPTDLIADPSKTPLRGYAAAQIKALRKSMEISEKEYQEKRKSEIERVDSALAQEGARGKGFAARVPIGAGKLSGGFIAGAATARSSKIRPSTSRSSSSRGGTLYHQEFEKHVEGVIAERRAKQNELARKTAETEIDFVKTNIEAMKHFSIDAQIEKAKLVRDDIRRENVMVDVVNSSSSPSSSKSKNNNLSASTRRNQHRFSTTTTTLSDSNSLAASASGTFGEFDDADAGTSADFAKQAAMSKREDIVAAKTQIFTSGLAGYIDRRIEESKNVRQATTKTLNLDNGDFSSAVFDGGAEAGRASGSASVLGKEKIKLWSTIVTVIQSAYIFDSIIAKAKGVKAQRFLEFQEERKEEEKRLQVQIPLSQVPQTWRTVLRLIREYVHRFRQRRYGNSATLVCRFLKQQKMVTQFSRAVQNHIKKMKNLQRALRRYIVMKRAREALVARWWLSLEVATLQGTVNSLLTKQQQQQQQQGGANNNNTLTNNSFSNSFRDFGSGSVFSLNLGNNNNNNNNMQTINSSSAQVTPAVANHLMSTTISNLLSDPSATTITHTAVQKIRMDIIPSYHFSASSRDEDLSSYSLIESYDTVSIVIPQELQKLGIVLATAPARYRQQWIRKFVSDSIRRRAAAVAHYNRERRLFREQVRRVQQLSNQGVKLSSNQANLSEPKPPLRYLLPSKLDCQNAIKWAQKIGAKQMMMEAQQLRSTTQNQQQQTPTGGMRPQQQLKRSSLTTANNTDSPMKRRQSTASPTSPGGAINNPLQQLVMTPEERSSLPRERRSTAPNIFDHHSQNERKTSVVSNSSAQSFTLLEDSFNNNNNQQKQQLVARSPQDNFGVSTDRISTTTTVPPKRPTTATTSSSPNRRNQQNHQQNRHSHSPSSNTFRTAMMKHTNSPSSVPFVSTAASPASTPSYHHQSPASSRPHSAGTLKMKIVNSFSFTNNSSADEERREDEERTMSYDDESKKAPLSYEEETKRRKCMLKQAWTEYVDSYRKEGKKVPHVVGSDPRIPPVLPDSYFVKLLMSSNSSFKKQQQQKQKTQQNSSSTIPISMYSTRDPEVADLQHWLRLDHDEEREKRLKQCKSFKEETGDAGDNGEDGDFDEQTGPFSGFSASANQELMKLALENDDEGMANRLRQLQAAEDEKASFGDLLARFKDVPKSQLAILDQFTKTSSASTFSSSKDDVVLSVEDMIYQREWDEITGNVALKITKTTNQNPEVNVKLVAALDAANHRKEMKERASSAASKVVVPHMMHSWTFDKKNVKNASLPINHAANIPRPPLSSVMELIHVNDFEEAITQISAPPRTKVEIVKDEKTGKPRVIYHDDDIAKRVVAKNTGNENENGEEEEQQTDEVGMSVALSIQQRQQQQRQSNNTPGLFTPRPPSSFSASRPNTAAASVHSVSTAKHQHQPNTRPSSSSSLSARQNSNTTPKFSQEFNKYAAQTTREGSTTLSSAASLSSRPLTSASQNKAKREELSSARARFFAPRGSNIVTFSSLAKNSSSSNVVSSPRNLTHFTKNPRATTSSAVAPAATTPLSVLALETHERLHHEKVFKKTTR